MPLKKPNQNTKENYAPKQPSQSKEIYAKQKYPIKSENSKVVEEDITKIAKSYILEGNKLKKNEPIF